MSYLFYNDTKHTISIKEAVARVVLVCRRSATVYALFINGRNMKNDKGYFSVKILPYEHMINEMLVNMSRLVFYNVCS